MKVYNKMLVAFFAPVVLVAYWLGVYKIISTFFISHPPMAFFFSGLFVVVQVLTVYAAGEVGLFEDDKSAALEGKKQ